MCIAYGSTMEFPFPFQKKIKKNRDDMGFIRSGSANAPITILPFRAVKKYYDGSVALSIFISSVIQQSQSFFFFFFYIYMRFENKKVCDAEKKGPDR